MIRSEGLLLQSSCCNCLVSLGVDSHVAWFDLSSIRFSVSQALQLVFNTETVGIREEQFLKLCPLCGDSLERLLTSHEQFTRLSSRGSYVNGLRKNLAQANEEVEFNEFECRMKQESEDEEDSTGLDRDPLTPDVEECVVKYEPVVRTYLRRSMRMCDESGKTNRKNDKNENPSSNKDYRRLNKNEASNVKHVQTSSTIPRRRNKLNRKFPSENTSKQNDAVHKVKGKDGDDLICGKVGCNATFGSLLRLRIHESKHSSEDRPFSCKPCATFYKLEKHLKKHNSRYHGVEKYPLRLRMWRRNQAKTRVAENVNLLVTTSYKCHLCPEVSFGSLKEWILHHKEIHGRELGYGDVSSHEQVKPVEGFFRPCPYCGKMKKKNYTVLTHIENVHLKMRPFSCDICQQQFYLQQNLKTHIDNKHLRTPAQFLCTLCGMSLKSKGGLILHERIHLDETIYRYNCSICTLKFSTKNKLSIHMASTHTDERPCVCDVCNAKFKHKYNLLRHKRIVHEKKFDQICEFCAKSYSDKTHLKEHLMSIHKLSKEAAFISAGMKSKKLFRILPNGDRIIPEKPTKPKTCGFCGRTYVRREQLFTHLIAVHDQTQEQAKAITGLESKRNLLPGSGGTRNKKKKDFENIIVRI